MTRHLWQSVLMILGIALGVAVVVAVDLANGGAGRAFDLSTAAVAGRATHQISGDLQGLDEDLYIRLKTGSLVPGEAGAPIAPVIEDFVTSPQLGRLPLQLLGIDPFAEPPFRDYLGAGYGGSPAAVTGQAAVDLTGFLSQPGAVLISRDLAERYSLSTGQPITLEIGGRTQPAFIAGLIEAPDALGRRALEGILLADIGAAQELTGKLGRLDRIDLILPEDNPAVVARLEQQLPAEARLEQVAARSGSVQQMTAAFRLNLTALSLLALVVGMFLIYNTITFSVVQRRTLFGTLRCLGVTRREIFRMVISEAAVVGLVGTGLGLALGVLMGQGVLQLVTQTMNDLFFVVTVRGIQAPPASLVKGGLVGLAATLLSAAPPAWEAASVPPRAALSRSGLELKARRAVGVAARAGLAFIAGGGAILALSRSSLLAGFVATFAIVVGFAMLVPITTGLLMRRLVTPLGRIWGSLGRMAPRGVANSLSRTAVAVMALMVAVSVTIGVSVMIGSFRRTVVTWLSETLQGDVYISAPTITATTPTVLLDPQVIAAARAWPGVERVDVLRSAVVASPLGPVDLSATDNWTIAQERVFLHHDLPIDTIWSRMLAGGVLVSEPFANRIGLPPQGGTVTLDTPDGPRQFPVLGIYYDYASTRGVVLMALPVFRQSWRDDGLTAIALRLAEDVSVDETARRLQDQMAPIQRLVVRPNAALRNEVLVVFDRTFAITGALQILATVVAFVGVLSSLLSLELERQRELGILRAVGLTVRQLWGLVLLETGLMGSVAGLLSLPTGYALALILVYIINRRSFGWTLQMQVDPLPFVQALAVATGAALLAGLYPAWRMGKMITTEAIRSE